MSKREKEPKFSSLSPKLEDKTTSFENVNSNRNHKKKVQN